MPEISRFFGIVIKMYYSDHLPPHFHAEYGEHQAKIRIDTLTVFEGRLPSRALGLVAEWGSLHQSELEACWQQAQELKPLGKIAPLE
jgi:hypothetical protein